MNDESERAQDVLLAQMLAEARIQPPVADRSFLERIAGDALAEQAALAGSRTGLASGRSGLQRLGAALAGRWEALAWPAGLTAATLAGVWLGGWADVNGFIGDSGLGTSDLAMSVVYRLPDATDLIGGF